MHYRLSHLAQRCYTVTTSSSATERIPSGHTFGFKMHYLRTTGYSLRLVTRCFGIQHQAKCSFASVNKSQLSKLRRATGYTFSACRDALVRHANHYDNALAWLEEEAVRLGWSKAGKLSGRSLTQGLVGVMETGDRVVMVEVNCETDFVARNEQFQNLVATTAEAVMNAYRVSCCCCFHC